MAGKKITVSLIKADVGGFTGHSDVHPELMKTANAFLKKSKFLVDFHVTRCGDDLELIMTHRRGTDDKQVHKLAWDCFVKCTGVARKLKLYGAGQDLLKEGFTGNIKGMGPGVAEMEFTERKSEPIIAFMMDKTEPGAFNFPIFKMFADPFNTAGLVIDDSMHLGFRFEVWDIKEKKKIYFDCPEELYSMLMFIGQKSHYVIKRVFPKKGNRNPTNEPAAVISTDKLSQIAGKYVGKDDPAGIVRAQAGLPDQGEVLEAFALAHLVSGWNRGSHNGPLMPCAYKDAHPTRFDGPPRVMALGFQLANGKLIGPKDLFDDPSFDLARQRATEITDYLRRMGPFQPHLLPEEDMEYTTMPKLMKEYEKKWKKVK